MTSNCHPHQVRWLLVSGSCEPTLAEAAGYAARLAARHAAEDTTDRISEMMQSYLLAQHYLTQQQQQQATPMPGADDAPPDLAEMTPPADNKAREGTRAPDTAPDTAPRHARAPDTAPSETLVRLIDEALRHERARSVVAEERAARLEAQLAHVSRQLFEAQAKAIELLERSTSSK
jgi:hypothetical protein